MLSSCDDICCSRNNNMLSSCDDICCSRNNNMLSSCDDICCSRNNNMLSSCDDICCSRNNNMLSSCDDICCSRNNNISERKQRDAQRRHKFCSCKIAHQNARSRIRTCEDLRQRILSPSPLTAREPLLSIAKQGRYCLLRNNRRLKIVLQF